MLWARMHWSIFFALMYGIRLNLSITHRLLLFSYFFSLPGLCRLFPYLSHPSSPILDNDMVNGTKLLNVAGMSRGKRDGILKNEKGRVVVKVGAMHLKGVW